MAETYEVTRYAYYLFSSRTDSIGNGTIMLHGATRYLGAASFSNEPSKPLNPAVKYPSGVIGLYYRMDDMPIILDMLRNEKPVYLIYDGGQNSRLATTDEAVGEGEI